jgi:hypothetical protein
MKLGDLIRKLRRRLLGPPTGYFEEPCPLGDGSCSDNRCPCGSPGTRIPHGSGFLIVPKQVASWRRDARTQAALKRKRNRVEKQLLLNQLTGRDLGSMSGLASIASPILCCDQSPLLKVYDREIAANDAVYWWKHELIPLRSTPQVSRR